jgi:hypothetical protein
MGFDIAANEIQHFALAPGLGMHFVDCNTASVTPHNRCINSGRFG